MVACAGGYYGAQFQGFRRVTHGYPLSTTIFNVVVEAVINHWILLVAGGVVRKDGWGREVTHCAAISMRMMAWLYQHNQSGCRYCLTPSPVFDMVGIQKNSGKTVEMIFCPCRVVGT